MPYFDVDQLSSGEPYSWAYVVSVMLFPHEERARHASEHAFGAHALKEALAALLSAGMDGPVDAALALWMCEAPHPRDLVPRRSYRAALLAGATLNYVIRAAEHTPELASVGSFLRGLAQELQKTQTPANSVRTLKDAWARYSSVAHLWACVDHLSAHSDQEHLLIFLAFAEELRKRGEAYIPRHGREPVLDPTTTWKMPAGFRLPEVDFQVRPPRSETLEMVSRSKNQN